MGLGGADDPAGTTWRAVALSPVRPHVGDALMIEARWD
jgi:hypothetical protein